jgi:hypothetical protein
MAECPMSKGKRNGEAEELDLVPIMNLVTILIPFLLMASSFVTLAAIDSTLPAIGPPSEPTDEKPEETLNLSIAITNEGFTIIGTDAVLKGDGPDGKKGPTLPCKRAGCDTPDSYDTKQLTEMLSEIKDRWEDEDTVILVPESQIAYETLILTMDAAREDPSKTENDENGNSRKKLLFPSVVIAGGAQ